MSSPVGRSAFDFPALTYFSERPSDRIPYITLFPVGKTMRANLFVYREVDDPWLREFRRAPVETLNAVAAAAEANHRRVRGPRRHQDPPGRSLYQLRLSAGRHCPGRRCLRTTCPVTGTGTDKVFTDVARLCNVHIPAWLATEGMDEDKIAAFYDDPVKQACDEWAIAKAYHLPRDLDR